MRGIASSFSYALAACFITDPLIELVLLGGDAVDLFVPTLGFLPIDPEELGVAKPGTRIRLRIGQRHRQFERILVYPSIALLQTHFFAVRVAEFIEPSTIVKPNTIDNKHV